MWRGRRRVSQLELALRAGTTQRHVSFIEGGRSVPGRAMVVRLAEALEVPLRERNTLLLAAGYAPAYHETRFDDPKLDPVRTALARVLDGHLPYPAVIVDRHGDLVAANHTFWVLTHGVAGHLRKPPVNIPRLLLHPHGMAPRIANLDQWAWHVIDALRQETMRNPNDRLQALVTELEGLVPSTRGTWDRTIWASRFPTSLLRGRRPPAADHPDPFWNRCGCHRRRVATGGLPADVGRVFIQDGKIGKTAL
jgi:transcriptional regulator with XRE-family HTH domain